MALTKPQRARLDKLATYLEGLPKNYRHFKMAWWLSGADDEAAVNYARKNGGVASCGTAACAAGHGPAAGILVPPRFIEYGEVQWPDYCALFIGGNEKARLWLFGGTWRYFDDHHWGAAARIRYLLDKGSVPKTFRGPAKGYHENYAPYRIDAKVPA